MNPLKKKTRKQRFGADGVAVGPLPPEEVPMEIDNHPVEMPDATEEKVVEPYQSYSDIDPNTDSQHTVPLLPPNPPFYPTGGTLPLAPTTELVDDSLRISVIASELLKAGTITQMQYQTVTGAGLGGMKRKSIYMKDGKLMCKYDNNTVTSISPDGTEKATTWTILGVTWTKLYWVAAFGGVALLLAVLAIWANKK